MSTQEKTTRSNVETVRELMRRWDAGWAARDARQLADMMADDATWEDPVLARPISGKHELQRYFEAVLRSFPDIEVRQEEIFVDVDDDSRFASRFVLRGTFRETLDSAGYAAFPIAATGDRVEVTGVGTGSLRDGKLSRVQQYVDYTTFQRQIGMLPPLGSRAERVLGRLQALGARRRRRKNAKRS